VQATDGNFYGTTPHGGRYGNNGTVFKITPQGSVTTLHSFDNTDGAVPMDLVQATNGNLYGTTSNGGDLTCNFGQGCGTFFEITTGGKLTTLRRFSNTDGVLPIGLVQATDGNFYGTTILGGNLTCPQGCGTVFEITPGGKLTTLHLFHETDGAEPFARPMQATDGNFYGTTTSGGDLNCASTAVPPGCGTVFSVSVGLGPFVETQPTSGKVGATVIILGNNLTDATSVTFNGKAATFMVVSSTEIMTIVPSGATPGKVKVKTPVGTLTSNVNFRVSPTISSFSPTSGPVGTDVVITGESFTGATSVTFGGVNATSFTVDSSSEITATVPTGAKTGKIGVTTPGGTATSVESFTVTM
jgi:uncharacterized repeat protein (TIGR03803 family)